ncbi:MAG: glycoside hydrolase family 57 protein [Candidatus Omnitrophica bacterium]|nr:glycoside hydrolase family 57 protein [Candidatus Omnitrophota bacterium]
MLYLAFIFHMHQPYYKNLLTDRTDFPWVRLHGTKDYLDMVKILENFPNIHQTINLVPSLVEQIDDYINGKVKDKFLELSYKPAATLTQEEKDFIRNNFFMINKDKVICFHPRYYQLWLAREQGKDFHTQDYLDLQVWFNLAWVDPYFRNNYPQLRALVKKARFFNEEDKHILLRTTNEILEDIIPVYTKMQQNGQIEITVSPYYHPILPLLYNVRIAKEANPRSTLPVALFNYPEDVKAQIELATKLYQEKFGTKAKGMWPSEQAVSEHILPFIIQAGINWIVADEGILFRSLKKKHRDTRLLYQVHKIKHKDGQLNIVFRDRNLSDLIGFVYPNWNAQDAVNDFMHHLENIYLAFGNQDVLVTIAMDGENAWEYYTNDGHDFLENLYNRIENTRYIKTVTISEYLAFKEVTSVIPRLSAGSWIYSEFSKWINNPYKNKGWDYLTVARRNLQEMQEQNKPITDLAWKQMYILEGSDWFWWLGEDYPGYFDRLFRMHLTNFYALIDKEIPEYLNRPISP